MIPTWSLTCCSFIASFGYYIQLSLFPSMREERIIVLIQTKPIRHDEIKQTEKLHFNYPSFFGNTFFIRVYQRSNLFIQLVL